MGILKQTVYKAARYFSLILVVLLALKGLSLKAQNESVIRAIITEGDLKKLQKADDLKVQADNLFEEANRLNMEVFSVQADPTLDEKAGKKKAAQLESQALQKQQESASLYEKCNEIKFTLYKQYIDAFWKSHEGKENDYLNAKLLEEQASDNYFQAISYRLEAKKMDAGYARIEKLTEANNLELQAIQKQVSALSNYYGISEEPTANEVVLTTDTSEPSEINNVQSEPTSENISIPETDQPAQRETSAQPEYTLPAGGVVVNQSMIDRYNRYISSGQLNDTTLSTGKIAGVNEFDRDNLLKLWYEYLYGRQATDEEQQLVQKSDTAVAADQTTAVTPSAGSPEKEIGIVTDQNRGTLIPADDEVIYRVQIAANKSELTQKALSKMYYGNKNVEMLNENGWFKYSVGDFSSYEEANNFRKQSGMSNAFVVAYRKGTRFVQNEETPVTQPVEAAYTPQGNNRLPSGLIFRIQVAASRVPLTIGQLKRIYPGNYPVEMILEDGWYKYQFMGVRLYSDALQIIRNVSSNGVFIVAYENGAKIDLASAVKKNKELEELVKTRGRKGYIQEIEFHLQLAASRVAMKPDELSSLYHGSESISVVYEDGWYKYHLKAGNSAEEAEQFRKTSGIPKAFIVPYKSAMKIDLLQAIQELK